MGFGCDAGVGADIRGREGADRVGRALGGDEGGSADGELSDMGEHGVGAAERDRAEGAHDDAHREGVQVAESDAAEGAGAVCEREAVPEHPGVQDTVRECGPGDNSGEHGGRVQRLGTSGEPQSNAVNGVNILCWFFLSCAIECFLRLSSVSRKL